MAPPDPNRQSSPSPSTATSLSDDEITDALHVQTNTSTINKRRLVRAASREIATDFVPVKPWSITLVEELAQLVEGANKPTAENTVHYTIDEACGRLLSSAQSRKQRPPVLKLQDVRSVAVQFGIKQATPPHSDTMWRRGLGTIVAESYR
ncbi:hypothetical protein ACHAPU_009043 [Fusarium lateritium]